MTELRRTGRNVFAKLAGLNFSWVIEGKLGGSRGPRSKADLAMLKRKGVGALVRLVEPDEAFITPSDVHEAGLEDFCMPIHDFTTPTQLLIDHTIEYITSCLKRGVAVDVSCNAGIGRTGVILACYLMHQGYSMKEALKLIRKKRRVGPLVQDQNLAIEAYWSRVSSQSSV